MMKHQTVKDIKRSYRSILLLSVSFILLGLVVSLLFVINPTPKYEDMTETTVRIDSVRYISSYRGGGHYELKTTDGIFYHLSGDFHVSELEALPKGTEIQIKWYEKTWLFEKTLYIEEIIFQNERISTYTNDDREGMIFGFFAGGLCIAMGIGGIFLYRHFVHQEMVKLPKKYRK